MKRKKFFKLTPLLIAVTFACSTLLTACTLTKPTQKTTKTKTTVAKKEKPLPKDPNPTNIPVLMYHSIAYEKGNDLRIPQKIFREQMDIIKHDGFTPITLDELYSHFNDEVKLPPKPIVITLDDGYKDNYENALPVLKEFGFKATVFVITCQTDDSTDFMTSKQLKEMQANGIDIECHTVTHPHLKDLSYDKQLVELRDSKAKLEKMLNKKINYIAYPYGSYNDDTVKLVQSLGYKMAFTTNEGQANKTQGMFTLDRMYISNANDIAHFQRQINGEIK